MPNVTSPSTLDTLARVGYAVKGVVYAIIGGLALQLALGDGGATTGAQGAVTSLADEAYGQVALWAIAAGLGAYVLWRLAQSLLDTGHEGSDTKGAVKRLAYFGSAVANGAVAVTAARAAIGDGSGSSGGDGTQDWTADLMGMPAGRWLVAAAALVMLGVAAYQFHQAYTARFMRRMGTHELSGGGRQWLERLGRLGIGARAVVFALVGVFLGVAAWRTDPSEARGVGGALDALRDWGPGPYLLGAVALGLLAYALYCLGAARYRRFAAD